MKIIHDGQPTMNKLQELKSKTHTDKLEDIPHAKTQVLRELAKDNVSSEKGVVNPKRSDADKAVIKAAIIKKPQRL